MGLVVSLIETTVIFMQLSKLLLLFSFAKQLQKDLIVCLITQIILVFHFLFTLVSFLFKLG